VRYLIVAEAYRDLEQVSSRLALTERLAALLAQTPAPLLPTVCYLCQGLIAPEFAGVDLGLAEKLAVRALATAVGADAAQVTALVRETGDLGQAAEQLLTRPGAGDDGRAASLEVTGVVRTLRKIAAAEGAGSQGRKLDLVGKSTGPDSAYQAGARGWQWIKLKRDYRTELSDTADLVVIGAFAGRGRRTGVYGAVLLAAYDADAGLFRAVTKCGAGFSDADLAALPARLAPLLSPHKPARVDARQEPDVWFEPGLVLEILSAELTLSPNYTAAWGQIQDDAGLAMRFPRFTGRWRDDKAPEDATTTREMTELFLQVCHCRGCRNRSDLIMV